ncbi:MAG: AAA domain-containing protein [Proteobacteria bacterium]|nr:AAA domain-containing protein [Pseudomonadota bacterium]
MKSEFVKSILNYYAAFTETRFSNRSTLSYRWHADANLNLDISFLSEFYKVCLEKLRSGDLQDVVVSPNQYNIEIPLNRLKNRILETLNTALTLPVLSQCIDDAKANNEADPLRRGIRAFNLLLRKAIEGIIHELYTEEIEKLRKICPSCQFPSTTFNPSKFTQDIYDELQRKGDEVAGAEDYFRLMESHLQGIESPLTLYDLYLLLKNFVGQHLDQTVYLFFGSIAAKAGNGTPDYPLFFIEVGFDSTAPDRIVLSVPRDLVLINTPAINSFEFDKILSTPRACSFAQISPHLKQVDDFLITEYKLPQQDITLSENPFTIPGPKEEMPTVQFRFGFQAIKDEDKRLLDYSELMTRIEKGSASKIMDFVDGYLNGNVKNTVDKTEQDFRERYPAGSPGYYLTDNPLPLNTAQKRILTALTNPDNKVIVIDGPPGTGKSHTIAAITYWANQNARSVVVTSHKKEALDVVDGMLTDKFKGLHPYAKPSIIRITKSYDSSKIDSLNSMDNSLSLPVVDAATARTNEFNKNAVESDRDNIRQTIEQQIAQVIDSGKSYRETVRHLLRYFELEEELKEKNAIDIEELTRIPYANSHGKAFETLTGFIETHNAQDFRNISMKNLIGLYQSRQDIPRVLEVCERVNEISPVKKNINFGNMPTRSEFDDFRFLIDRLRNAFDPDVPFSALKVDEINCEKHEIQKHVHSYEQLCLIETELKDLANLKPQLPFFNKKYKTRESAFKKRYPDVSTHWDIKKLSVKDVLGQVSDEIAYIGSLKGATCYTLHFIYSLTQEKYDFQGLRSALNDQNSLRFSPVYDAICQLRVKTRTDLTLNDIIAGIHELETIMSYESCMKLINEFQHTANLENLSIRELYNLLGRLKTVLDDLDAQRIDDLNAISEAYGTILKSIQVDFGNLETLFKIKALTEGEKKLFELIRIPCRIQNVTALLPEIKRKLDEYGALNQRLTEYDNDKRLKNLHNYHGDMNKIKLLISKGKRLSAELANILFSNFACIIAEPEAIFKHFPMEEDLIDILVFDEASQVSIAHSISLILRAKQVIVFGDKYQYGAVSAVNVSRKYAASYFQRIIDNYTKEYNVSIAQDTYDRLIQEESAEIAEEDLFIPEVVKNPNLTGQIEWLKTFSIRTSTLSFCEAIANFHTSLTEHFRSFKEIISYSNTFFYERAQIPLIVNRLRTKPIDEVLRFIKVETKGKAGNNTNLDEIEAIRKDIESLITNGFKGTVGIITSFREQKPRIEEYLRKKLPNFHRLKVEHKLAIWFVGDVQGEERDIVYYSFVEDKQLNNGSLSFIYPTPGGSAARIESLKMQRLNVGFSRAKDTMVFVHSMPIDDYMDTLLGEALKHYHETLQEAKTNDCFISDKTVFESPKEKELYGLIVQTKFFRDRMQALRIIPQFDIGKYIKQEFKRFIPSYRADFLVTLSEGGRDKSLILEYDGLEYHTKDPRAVRSVENFREEYLDYDIRRQLELESYGYHFLRINKFSLLPKQPGQTKPDVLNELLEESFA